MILDLSDKTWLKYFTKSEINEMIFHNTKTMPSISAETSSFLKKIGKLKTANDFYEFHRSAGVTSEMDKEKAWILLSIYNAFALVTTGKLTAGDKSEAYYVHRVWSMIETAFDTSPVSCIT